MIITVDTDNGIISRVLEDDCTWGEAMDSFLDCLRGMGYVITAFNEDIIDAAKDLNGTI